jgi:hypothetical protein
MDSVDNTPVASKSQASSPDRADNNIRDPVSPLRISLPPSATPEPCRQTGSVTDNQPIVQESNGKTYVPMNDLLRDFRPSRIKTGMQIRV